MNQATESAPLSIQGFLTAILAYFVPNLRSAEEFIKAFPASVIMHSITNADLRAQILQVTGGTKVELGRKMSPRAAAEQLELTLTEGISDPATVLRYFPAEDRVKSLKAMSLWTFIAEQRWWEYPDTQPERTESAKTAMEIAIDQALKLGLIGPRALVEAIGFATFFADAKKEAIVDAFEIIMSSDQVDRFGELLGLYSPEYIASHVPLVILWEEVIHPLIAVKYGLVEDSQSPSPPEEDEEPPSVPLAAKSEPVAAIQSKSATADAPADTPVKPESSSPIEVPLDLSKTGIPTGHLSLTGLSLRSPLGTASRGVSSVPAAHRAASAEDKKGGDNGPKANEASDGASSDADEDGAPVNDDELIGGDDGSNESDEDTDRATNPGDEGKESLGIPIVVESEVSNPPPRAIPDPPPVSKRPPSSSMIPVVHAPPRPDPDRQVHRSSDVEIVVTGVSPQDALVVAALEAEEDGVTEGRDSDIPRIPDGEFLRAGGASKFDPTPPSTEAPSINSLQGPTAICLFLRREAGLKLRNLDPFACELKEVILLALNELNPGYYHEIDLRYNWSDEGYGGVLCDELTRKNPTVANRLRELFERIGCVPTREAPKTRKPGPPALPKPSGRRS